MCRSTAVGWPWQWWHASLTGPGSTVAPKSGSLFRSQQIHRQLQFKAASGARRQPEKGIFERLLCTQVGEK